MRQWVTGVFSGWLYDGWREDQTEWEANLCQFSFLTLFRSLFWFGAALQKLQLQGVKWLLCRAGCHFPLAHTRRRQWNRHRVQKAVVHRRPWLLFCLKINCMLNLVQRESIAALTSIGWRQCSKWVSTNPTVHSAYYITQGSFCIMKFIMLWTSAIS